MIESVKVLNRIDAGLFLVIACVGLLQYHHFSKMINPALSTEFRSRDVWFDADMIRVSSLETDRAGRHTRNTLHPLLPIVAYPPVFVLRRFFALPSLAAVRLFNAGVAGIWLGAYFLLLRQIGCRRPDGVVFTMVLGTSASAFFWLTVPESFTLGSLTFFPAFILAARKNPPNFIGEVVAHVVGLSITISNWMAAAILTLVRGTRRRFMLVSATAFFVVMVLSVLQRSIFPNIDSSAVGRISNESVFVFMPEAGGFWSIARTFLFHGMIAPGIGWLPNFRLPNFPLMSFQSSPLFSGPRAGVYGTAIWAALLVIGFVSFFFAGKNPDLKKILGVTLLCQIAMHGAYGRETFLYSLNYVPMLVAVVALAAQTRARWLVLSLSVFLFPLNIANNRFMFEWCTAYTQHFSYLQERLAEHPFDEEKSRERIGISSEPKPVHNISTVARAGLPAVPTSRASHLRVP